ncbi:crossover junction endodeoxyribonuclease RuvC [Microvirga sp. W0021]|uniref:Crossover junction endodeoxyribonuclease RuvC n=1 Tax=Hohaiivirga grylli TaxID=3133970 RepID=A0ABV0BKH8_9HYPH
MAEPPIRILGVDPGLRRTGWGVIVTEGTRLSYLGCGTIISNDKAPLAERLRELHDGLEEIIKAYAPDEASVEETFVNKDAQATLKLGHARGIALLVPALHGISVGEYSANMVKKTVVGSGHADKQQIQAMIKVLLPKATYNGPDAADALAIAITHAHHRKARALAKGL